MHSWVTMIGAKRRADWVKLRPIWLLRTRLAFVVTNIQVRVRLSAPLLHPKLMHECFSFAQ
jgi:hypothetical protein